MNLWLVAIILTAQKITPSRSSSGDRFIPNRRATQFDVGHFLVTNSSRSGSDESLSPSKQQFRQVMSENLNNGVELANTKIIAYQQKPPVNPEG